MRVLSISVNPAKLAEPIKMPLLETRVNPSNHVLDGVTLAPPGQND